LKVREGVKQEKEKKKKGSRDSFWELRKKGLRCRF